MQIDWNLVVFFAPFVALGISLIALLVSVSMHLRVGKIFRSASSSDIESLLKLHTKTLEEFVKFKAETEELTRILDKRVRMKMTNTSVLRFNPFQGEGVGGNQSFSSVFADEEGNGAVITSMHTRERTNVFAKPIANWQSEYELSGEEKSVLENAKNK
jgi:hypothetical protein